MWNHLLRSIKIIYVIYELIYGINLTIYQPLNKKNLMERIILSYTPTTSLSLPVLIPVTHKYFPKCFIFPNTVTYFPMTRTINVSAIDGTRRPYWRTELCFALTIAMLLLPLLRTKDVT